MKRRRIPHCLRKCCRRRWERRIAVSGTPRQRVRGESESSEVAGFRVRERFMTKTIPRVACEGRLRRGLVRLSELLRRQATIDTRKTGIGHFLVTKIVANNVASETGIHSTRDARHCKLLFDR